MTVIPFIYNEPDDFAANCYLIVDSSKNCVVVDPSVNTLKLTEYILNNHYHLKAILLTHAHFDHIGGVDILTENFKVPLYMGEEDIPLLIDPAKNGSEHFNHIVISKYTSPSSVYDNEKINVLEEEITVITTPYHTKGGVCYYFNNSQIIFTGDSLFKMGLGRSDLYGAIPRKAKESINKLMALNDCVKVYPGHGRFTTIGEEKCKNPFIKRL